VSSNFFISFKIQKFLKIPKSEKYQKSKSGKYWIEKV